MARSQLVPGMAVLGSDREQIGTVKEVLAEAECFRVDVPMAPDYYIPLEAVAGVEGENVMLRVSKVQAAYSGWELRPEGS